jgi:Spy/CpxP family protein refolding chaperone
MAPLLWLTMALGIAGLDGAEVQRSAEELGLSREQQTAIRDLTDEARAQQQRARADVDLGEIELRRELEKDAPDPKKVAAIVDRLSGFEAQARKLQLLAWLKVRAMLTPAQRHKLEELRAGRTPRRRDAEGHFDPFRGPSDGDGATGMLLINSQPWARILIDGEDSGKSTPARIRLPAGLHRVTLVDGERRIEERIDLKPGGEVRIVRSFER